MSILARVKTMRIVYSAGIALSLLLTVGCGGTGGRPPVEAPALSDAAALDAQATLAVWSAQGTAVAAETRRVEQATADAAQQQQQATAGAAAAIAQATQAAQAAADAHGTAVAVEATGTAAAYQAAATTQAISATATGDALAARQWEMGIAATATADAAALAFQEASAAKALADKQADLDRQAMWTGLLPWLVGGAAVAVILAGLVMVAGSTAKQVVQARPQKAGDVWVMVDSNGTPTALNRPPRLLPAGEPARQIAAVSSAPDNTPIPLPPMRHGHVLIAGPTDSGKSTAMLEILRLRREVVVLDPHWDGGDWGAAEVIGAGRDFGAIGRYMEQMNELLRTRYAERAAGRAEFAPLTVAVDEMPAIVDELGKDIENTWRRWLREGRKVGLFLVVASQSTRVKTLGIEGERDLLENFAFVLALGETARREYPRVVAGMARPAALVTNGAARPVVIPWRPAASSVIAPAGDLDGDGDEDVILLPGPGPMFTAPTPRPKADARNMRPEDVALIRSLLAEGRTQRAVENEVFGYTGGAAWEAVAAVLNGNNGGHSGSFRPAAHNPTPGY